MKYVYKLAILALVLLSQNNVFASDNKTIKFHKAETEAEKALDNILRINNGSIRNKNIKEMLTNEFDEDYKRQENEALNSEACKKEGGYDCLAWDGGGIECGNADPEFGYIFYTSYEDEQKAFVSKMWSYEDMQGRSWINLKDYGKVTKDSISQPYIMKKEDSKWKLDGVCCNKINCSTPPI